MRLLSRWVAPALALFAALACVQPAAAQSASEDVCSGDQAGLGRALRRNWDNQVQLMAKRGFSLSESRREQERAVAHWLRGLPDGAAAAVLVGDSNRHCVYVVDNDGLKRFAAAPVGADGVKALHAAWRKAARVDQASPGKRAAVFVAAAGASAPKPRKGEADAALEALAAAVFPDDVRQVLSAYRRVLVLPYGDLGVTPFPALPTGDGRVLADTTAVMVLPGVQLAQAEGGPWVYRHDRPCGAPAARKGALIIGDPVARDPDYRFPALPGARREALAAGERLNATPLIGEEATLTAVRAAAPSAGVIHVAAHGMALNDAPLDSFIALSDGRWTARDIMGACLEGVELAVLSACQSGLGESVSGGVIGLARAFYLAGVDNVVMSLWSVDDKATERLMDAFGAERLKGGVPDDEALRRAMLSVRRTLPDPSKWAAFTVFGSSMIADGQDEA